jgi:hypothetical protein
VLELGTGLENIVNSGLTQQDGIYGINIRYSSSNLVGPYPLLSYHVVNEKNQQIDDNLYYRRKTEALSEINTLLSQHIDKGFKITDRTYVDKDFKSDEWFYLDCSNGIKEQVINLFLNDELKKVVNYSRMQMDLPVNNTNQSKKVKM